MINERYLIKNKLGEGRSKVFLCNDNENPSEDVAIKVLSEKADKAEKEIFQNEFITLRRLRHPNIVQAVNFGTIVKIKSSGKGLKPGSQFFTLEYFNGKPLLDYEDVNDESSLRKIITQICSALFYLHQSDYIYYDLKPDNILVKKSAGEPLVKLIDMGFAEKSDPGKTRLNSYNYVKGTAEYIAPELLKKDNYDGRVDLYSLGIILYRIIYKKFPFATDNELQIYKAHLEQDFDFKKSNYSKKLINVIKKLLEKEPANRYSNSLEVLSDLDIPFSSKLVKDWSPAKIFVNRKDVLNILDTYIHDKTSSEIFSIKGFEGSGKTALSEEINFIYKNSVQIKNDRSKSGYLFLKYFLKQIIFTDFIYSNISDETLKNIDNILQNTSRELIEELKGIFAKITQESNFILILDDFNSYDNFTVEMLKDILPILQVNKVKIIVTEDSDYDYITDSFHNVKEINLTPFTDVQVSELLNKSYNKFFPVEELKKIILLYADLLPGSIEGFIKDCLQLNIFQYNPAKITISVTENTARLLKSSRDQIYEIRLTSLSKNGIEAAKILSLFELNLDEKILADLLQSDRNKISLVVEELRDNNILHPSNIGANLQFTSEGLKKHVYLNINKKKEFHLNAGRILRRKYPSFDRNELARQYELGEEYDVCYEIVKKEVNEAEKLSAYSYQKNLLEKLLSFPLNEKYIIEIKYNLCEILFKLGNYKNALELIDDLLQKDLRYKFNNELKTLRGMCLIELGEYQKGQEILKSNLETIPGIAEKNKLLLSIAYANFDLKKFDDAKQICSEIINDKNSSHEEKGKSYNLIGMIEINQNNNLDIALQKFQNALDQFESAKLMRLIAATEANKGIIFDLKNDKEKTVLHFNAALKSNMVTGNLEQEAKILLNYGVYYYNNSNFEEAVTQYTKAYNIFLNLGDINGQGAVLNNLGEVYLIISEYQKSYNSLIKSSTLFEKIQNTEDKIESLFLLSKFYSTIGDLNKIEEISNECNSMEKKHHLGIKHENFIRYIKLISFNNEEIDLKIKNLKEICNVFLELNDIYNFAKAYLLVSNRLIVLNMFKEAFEIINNSILIEKCQARPLLEAERLYLLGKICYNYQFEIEEEPINLYNKAFDLIKDENITELTWKVLLEIAEYYSSRGNHARAKDYAVYAKSVIFHIAEKINDINLREIYLNTEEKKEAIKKLSNL